MLRDPIEGVVMTRLQLGWDIPMMEGVVVVMTHETMKTVIPVPMHGGKDVKIGTLRQILKMTGVTVEEWNNL